MNLLEFADHLEREVRKHVEEACQLAAQEIQRTTPSDRKKTKAAVAYRVNGLSGRIGLRFRTKYPTSGTPTLRRLESQWKGLRPRLRNRFIRRINDTLKGN